MKIAIVEDDPTHLHWMRLILENSGHTVFGLVVGESPLFNSGETILTGIEEFNPDFVLLDHDLGQAFKGSDLAAHLDTVKCIGTSTTFPQKYCGREWSGKGALPRERVEEFLDLFKE